MRWDADGRFVQPHIEGTQAASLGRELRLVMTIPSHDDLESTTL